MAKIYSRLSEKRIRRGIQRSYQNKAVVELMKRVSITEIKEKIVDLRKMT